MVENEFVGVDVNLKQRCCICMAEQLDEIDHRIGVVGWNWSGREYP